MALLAAARSHRLPGEDDSGWQAERQRTIAGYYSDAELPPFPVASAEEAAFVDAGLKEALLRAHRELAAARVTPALLAAARLDGASPTALSAARRIVDDLGLELAAAPLTLEARIAGEPILDRGFARSVGRNQVRSMVVSSALTLVFLLLLFRSVRTAIACFVPAQLTLAFLFAGMGLLGRHIDLGTSMVTATAVGIGTDLAMHYAWYLRRSRADEVSREIGPIGLVAVALIALGFFVLALGASPITRTFGLLAGLSALLSALLTLSLLPPLLRLFSRRRP
jgi:predicted RND superfamily exporter protein